MRSNTREIVRLSRKQMPRRWRLMNRRQSSSPGFRGQGRKQYPGFLMRLFVALGLSAAE